MVIRKDDSLDSSQENSLCGHDYQWVDEARVSEGENLAGKMVKCIMQDAYCQTESVVFLRRRSLSPTA